MRTPVYELHIKPLIRLMDREGMIWAFDLYNYDHVVAHAEQIADRAAVDMPPLSKGGPWPQEFVDLFRRWMVTGFKRLELGIGEYGWSVSGNTTTISANGVYPAPGYKAWLQLQEESSTARNYTLYLEAPDTPQPGNPATFQLKDKHKRTDSPEIFITDFNGIHKIH